jgi:hypothetical protein
MKSIFRATGAEPLIGLFFGILILVPLAIDAFVFHVNEAFVDLTEIIPVFLIFLIIILVINMISM